MSLPKPILNLIQDFERLPGIGSKTAQRLVFHLLHFPKEDIVKFSDDLIKLKTNVQLCSTCKNVSEGDKCAICMSSSRDARLIAVVSSPLDVYALERAHFKGAYHVLHGALDPLNNIGPDEIFVKELLQRITNAVVDPPQEPLETQILEVLLATATSLEGEATAMYISKLIRDLGYTSDQVKITRLARGLPIGGDIEYADDHTLLRALEGRNEF